MARPKSDRETKPLNIHLKVDLSKRVRDLAERERRSLTAQVELVMEAGLDVLEGKRSGRDR
jgi:hypothetical protein